MGTMGDGYTICWGIDKDDMISSMTNKYPTIKMTIKLIREMGLSASYSPEYSEFKVSHKGEKAYYFTNSRHDALETAQEMMKQKQLWIALEQKNSLAQ